MSLEYYTKQFCQIFRRVDNDTRSRTCKWGRLDISTVVGGLVAVADRFNLNGFCIYYCLISINSNYPSSYVEYGLGAFTASYRFPFSIHSDTHQLPCKIKSIWNYWMLMKKRMAELVRSCINNNRTTPLAKCSHTAVFRGQMLVGGFNI